MGVLAAVAIVLSCAGLSATSALADIAPQTSTGSIKGEATGLGNPMCVALDPEGRVYVANQLSAGLQVFARDASGNAAPIATLNYAGGFRSVASDGQGGIWGVQDVSAPIIVHFPAVPVEGGSVNWDRIILLPLTTGVQAIGVNSQGQVVTLSGLYSNEPSTLSTFVITARPDPYPEYENWSGDVNHAPLRAMHMAVGGEGVDNHFEGYQLNFDEFDNILVGGDGGNVYLLPRDAVGVIDPSTTPIRIWGGNGTPVGAAFTSDNRVVVTDYSANADGAVGLRLFSSTSSGSTPTSTVRVSSAENTLSPRCIGVGSATDSPTPQAKFAALGSNAVGVLALPSAASPEPSAEPGNSTGGGGQEVIPVATPTPTPTPSVSPTVVPSVTPSVTPSSIPSPSVPTPAGVVVLSGMERANAQLVMVSAPVSTSAVNAPQVTVSAGAAVAPVVSGLPASTPLEAGMSVAPLTRTKASFVSIGKTRSTANGRAKVPAFKASRAGMYTIRLSTPAGKAYYLKVKVAPKKASSTAGSSMKASGKSSR